MLITGLFCILFSSLTASSAPKIQISGEGIVLEAQNIKSWGLQIFNAENLSTGLLSCRPVPNLPRQSLACLSVGPGSHLAAVLGAASIFVEGNLGYSKGTLVDRKDQRVIEKLDKSDVAGYNLKGEDILEFIQKSKASCEAGNSGHCLSNSESSFFTSIDEFLRNESFNLLAVVFFPITLGESYISVLDHEALHVIYFRNDDYRLKVKKFWNEVVTANDKENILKIFAGKYDIQDEYVVLNEFQAYILQKDTEQSLLSSFVTEYRDKLSIFLKPLADKKHKNHTHRSPASYLFAPDYSPQRAVVIDGSSLKIGREIQPHYQIDFIHQLLATGLEVWVLAGDKAPYWMKNIESELEAAGFKLDAEDLKRIKLINSPGGSQWARDYSPLHLISKNSRPQHRIVDFKYQNFLNPFGDEIPQKLASASLGLSSIVKLPIEMEGGNFLCNSRICITSDKLLDKNPEKFGTSEKLRNLFRKFSTQELIVLPSLPYEENRHVDMYTAFLDDQTLVIAEIPDQSIVILKDAKMRESAYQVKLKLEEITQIMKAKLAISSSETKIVRLPMPAPIIKEGYSPLFRSYTNFLLANTASAKRVLVPSYIFKDCTKSSIEDQCSIPAVEIQVENILRSHGYQVGWVSALGIVPWQGSLHCTTSNIPAL